VLSSSWKARVEVRLTMLKKAKLKRYPFIQSRIEEDFITKSCHSVPPGYP
jgi:hypothetical protein